MKINYSNKFIRLFVNELQIVFNTKIDKQSWVDCYNGMSGTNGWYKALQFACENTDHALLLEYYNKLSWEYSDLFDCELGEVVEKYINNITK